MEVFVAVRKIFVVGLVGALVLGVVATAVGAEGTLVARAITAYYGNISVKVNGNVVKSDVEPFIVDGRTFVPLRAVGEALGMEVAWDQEKKQVSITGKPVSATDSAQASRAKTAHETVPELAFQRIFWVNGAPTAPADSGVWVYTKAAHPGNVDSINWDKNDLLLVQFSAERYPGHDLRIVAVQPIGADAVRIVCRLSPPRPDNSADKLRLPREYLVVDAGALAGKRFLFVDESLKELNTD